MQGSWDAGAPIFIVDDSKEDLLLLQRVLQQQCKILNPIILCHSGEQCLEELEKAIKEINLPVLVLLDLIMAPTSGLDVLQAMERQGSFQSIPVVMLSGIRDIQLVREGYQHGAQTFLIKPATPEDIMQVVSAVSRISVEKVSAGYVLHPAAHSPHDEPGESPILMKRSAAFPV